MFFFKDSKQIISERLGVNVSNTNWRKEITHKILNHSDNDKICKVFTQVLKDSIKNYNKTNKFGIYV